MAETVRKNLGMVTAYAYAVSKGYTGTEEEFAELMASYADVAQDAEASAHAAAQSATTAEQKATQAAGSATNAAVSATSASESAQAAAGSSNSANLYAQNASASATNAAGSASSASTHAGNASASAQDAESSANAAQASATQAAGSADDAEAAKDLVLGMNAVANTLPAGSQATASYSNGTLTLGIPKGDTGEKGDPGDTNDAPMIYSSASGSVVNFTDGADDLPLKSCMVNIEPIQEGSGDPSPENIRPISGRTGLSVVRSGKNLLKTAGLIEGTPSNTEFSNVTKRTFTVGTFVTKLTNNNYYQSKVNIQFSVSENSIKVTTSAKAYAISIPIVGLKIGETYVLSCTKTNASNNTVSFYKRDGTFISSTQSPTICKFTVPEETYYTLLHFTPSENNVEATFTNIQLELGPSETDYEPYKSSTYSVNWETEAGTVYGGSLDVVSGKLTVDKAYIASYNGETLPSTWISDRNVYVEGTTPTTGAQVVYKLADPVEYKLAPQEITTLLGTNNIWSDAGSMAVEYPADTKLYIDQKITEAIAAALA